jgi:hypothetical protein
MWSRVEQDLSQLLAGKMFPGLRGIAGYEKLLKPNGQPNPSACSAAAHAIITSTDLKSGIREFGSRESPQAREWRKPSAAPSRPRIILMDPGGSMKNWYSDGRANVR